MIAREININEKQFLTISQKNYEQFVHYFEFSGLFTMLGRNKKGRLRLIKVGSVPNAPDHFVLLRSQRKGAIFLACVMSIFQFAKVALGSK